MDYYLMHKELPVAVLDVTEKTGDIIDLRTVLQPKHLPLGAYTPCGEFDVFSLRKWWAERGIPASRSGLKNAMETLGIPYSEALLLKCSGLSLTDHYWVTPCNAPQSWHAVNFFENDFSEDVGRALFGEPVLSGSADLCSPCNTSDGFLQKRWCLANGKRILLKAGSGIYGQEPFNEVAACALFRRLGIPHIDYRLLWQGGQPLSACACFADSDIEFVSAAHLLRAVPQAQGTDTLAHFKHCATVFGIPDAMGFVANLLAADYLLANTDRHLGNFGFLRNSETLEWVGPAPAFDSGTSLWQMTLTRAIDAAALIPAKPFASSQEAQLQQTKEAVVLPLAALDGYGDECCGILAQNSAFDAGRAEAIGQAVDARIVMLANRLGKK